MQPSGFNTAERAQAKNDVIQIAMAVSAYNTEYGKLPSTNASIKTSMVPFSWR